MSHILNRTTPDIQSSYYDKMLKLGDQMIRHEKDNNGKRPQWKKDTRKKFTVHRKTAWKILVKRSQYIQRPHWVR